jgi:predicted phage tail protein
MAATMQSEETQGDAAATRASPDSTRLSRRQAIGRMSMFATAGAAVWVVPEILTAKAAGGATLSAPGVVTDASALAPAAEEPASKPAGTPANSLAFTGLNIQRDAEVGAALIAGGWALHHWASRAPASAPPAEGPGAPA